MTAVADFAEVARQAEELKAWNAVRTAAGDLGRARRYGWPEDRQVIIAENLAAARARVTLALWLARSRSSTSRRSTSALLAALSYSIDQRHRSRSGIR